MNYYCTLFDSFYLSRGLVMYESLKREAIDFHLYIFLFDEESYKILTNLKLEFVTIISLHEFEAFLCLPKSKQDFHKTIQAYFTDSRLETDPVSASGLPDSYRSYIIKKYGKPNAHGQYIEYLPELQSIFDNFAIETKEYFLT